jgi:hypothetical protein
MATVASRKGALDLRATRNEDATCSSIHAVHGGHQASYGDAHAAPRLAPLQPFL